MLTAIRPLAAPVSIAGTPPFAPLPFPNCSPVEAHKPGRAKLDGAVAPIIAEVVDKRIEWFVFPLTLLND